VLLGQKRIAATALWARQLAAAAQAVARREAAGDVSAYDRLRVERELHNAESRVATERAALEESWTRLAPLVGIEPRPDDDWPMLIGALLPATEPPALEDLAAAIETRADMRALEKEVQAAELQGDAAARGWIPSVTFGAGAKIVDADGNRDAGPIVTAFVPIPVFQREQAERMRADADARHTRAELLLRQAESLAQLRGAWRNVTRLTEAARSFARNTEDGSVQLVRSAEAAYRGGEIGTLELVDAYRAGLDDELRLLDLQLEARRARIELDLTAGGGL
jgi:cobalt-zinc-cadmium efflux system outer membrane protein